MIRTRLCIDRIQPKVLDRTWHETPRQCLVQPPSVVSLIGQTPLVPPTCVTEALSPATDLYIKLEGFNPGGSVKDRAALSIV
jgi:threonine synthase